MESPPKLSPDEAKEKILLILEDGFVEPTFHCLTDSMPKRNVDMSDIKNALQSGKVRRKPEWNDDYNNWKYRVEGYDVDGDDLIVITVIIDEDLTLKIITVF